MFEADATQPRTRGKTMRIVGLCAALLGISVHLHAAIAADWPDTFAARLEALALMETLNAELLSSDSATLTLERWCGDHRLSGAAAPTIVARLVSGRDDPATLDQRQRLRVGPDERVNFRHVQLLCGDRVLSEADNWYVPSRLTAGMNQALETSTVPFGKAVQSLGPYRQTFKVISLWHPLPEGWEVKPGGTHSNAPATTLSMPDALFEHRALLYTQDGRPFSEVHEVYQRATLDFTPPVSEAESQPVVDRSGPKGCSER